MLPENEQRIRALCGDCELADQILSIIEDDAQLRRAELAQRQTEGLKRAREQGTQLGDRKSVGRERVSSVV